jgi:glycosyltransferase involved in cell wall biosynthesis
VTRSTDLSESVRNSSNAPPALPTITVVTPSFNRKEYLAETMESVLGQGYPELEYIVVDGKSTDGSAELIEKRAADLAWWVSESDNGAWEAINKGFTHGSGEVMGWLGSDDLLMPWSLSIVGEIFATFPEIEWLTTQIPMMCDEDGRPVESFRLDAYSADEFFRGSNLPFAGWKAAGFIQQESTYWRRSLWERAGGRLDDSLKLAADFDLWARFHRAGAKLYGVRVPLACFRLHSNQLSQDAQGYTEEARRVLLGYGGNPETVPGVPALRRALVRFVPVRVQRAGAKTLAGILGSQPTTNALCVVRDSRGEGWRIEGR